MALEVHLQPVVSMGQAAVQALILDSLAGVVQLRCWEVEIEQVAPSHRVSARQCARRYVPRFLAASKLALHKLAITAKGCHD
jgi:hypothetical protein